MAECTGSRFAYVISAFSHDAAHVLLVSVVCPHNLYRPNHEKSKKINNDQELIESDPISHLSLDLFDNVRLEPASSATEAGGVPSTHNDTSPVMRKPVFAICEQQRRRSACASAQSDQPFCCSLPG